MAKRNVLASVVAAGGLTLLLSAPPVFAAPQTQTTVQYSPDRISSQGTITSITRSGDQYRIELNHGMYMYYVPSSMVSANDLRIGDTVRIGGLVNGDTVNADYFARSGQPAYAVDPMYRTVPYGSSGWLSGTVIDSNRHLNYITVRDDATGQIFKVDTRRMDTKRSVNVWRTSVGDHLNVNGSWENHDTFRANRIQY
jgi:hypothetical protein